MSSSTSSNSETSLYLGLIILPTVIFYAINVYPINREINSLATAEHLQDQISILRQAFAESLNGTLRNPEDFYASDFSRDIDGWALVFRWIFSAVVLLPMWVIGGANFLGSMGDKARLGAGAAIGMAVAISLLVVFAGLEQWYIVLFYGSWGLYVGGMLVWVGDTIACKTGREETPRPKHDEFDVIDEEAQHLKLAEDT